MPHAYHRPLIPGPGITLNLRARQRTPPPGRSASLSSCLPAYRLAYFLRSSGRAGRQCLAVPTQMAQEVLSPRHGGRLEDPLAGGPSTSVLPRSKTTTQSATRLAKIHFMGDATTIVMLVRQALYRRGPCRSSRSNAEVGSSNSMSRDAWRAPGDGDRCCWPPESWAGCLPAWSASPTLRSRSIASRSASRARLVHTVIGPMATLRNAVRKQFKILETPSHPPANLAHVVAINLHLAAVEDYFPPSGTSSALGSAIKVDLPEPLGPIRQTTCASMDVQRDAVQRSRRAIDFDIPKGQNWRLIRR